MMPIEDDDRTAFEREVRDVRPIKADDRVPRSPGKPQPRALHSRRARRSVLEESLTGRWHEAADGDVEFYRPAVSRRTLGKLKSGQFSIEAEIDLHGMSRERAAEALKAFLLESAARGFGCVRVVHGKGARSGPSGPVLKSAVHRWLARWDVVLAYVSARPRHGGNGAVYVLLRGL